MRILWILLFSLLIFRANADTEGSITKPPSPQPVQVKTHFFLVNLITIDEKNESFDAEVYFSFTWQDSRLAFASTDPNDMKVFLEESVPEKLKEIWWPQIEFNNASLPIYNNRSLFIFPDGTVRYDISITGTFYNSLDLSHFPFDKQKLLISIDSFLWNKDILQFIAAKQNNYLEGSTGGNHNDEFIKNITVEVKTGPGLSLKEQGVTEEFSAYNVTITIERKPGFYIYQVFVPLFIIMGISCSVFFAYRSDIMQTVGISLASFLVFLAAKFTINQDLPRVGYMTVIDKTFLVAYLIIGLSVVVCIIRELHYKGKKNWAYKVNYHASWFVFLLFLIIVFFIFLAQII